MKKSTNFTFPLIFILFACFSSKLQTSNTPFNGRTLPKRKLVDNFEFTTTDYFDSRTGVLRTYMEDLLKSLNKYNNNIKIASMLDSDNTFTTGNKDSLANLEKLIPNMDFKIVSQKVLDDARVLHESLKSFFNWITPDLFSEDPDMFIGDSSSYYLIVQKRGIVFYYLSRIMLYSLILYLFYVFILDKGLKFKKLAEPEKDLQKQPTRRWIQPTLIAFFIIGSLSLMRVMGIPRDKMNDSFSDLIFRFKNIKSSINSIIKQNNEINKLNIKVPNDKSSKFFIQNRLEAAIPLATKDIEFTDKFISSFQQQKYVTNLTIALVLTIGGLILFGFDRYAAKSKSTKIQFWIIIITGLTLSYLLSSLDRFFSGFTGINDFCLSMMWHGKKTISPFQGFGVSSLLGCSVQNNAFQQLYVNLIAQNAALKVFNNEMYKIGRETVKTTDDALQMIKYMSVLDCSNSQIDSIGKLLIKNTEVIKNLLEINGCNNIRAWINNSQRDFCVVATKMVLWSFILMIFAAVVLGALFAFSFYLFNTMTKNHSRERILNFNWRGETVINEVHLR